MKEVLAALGIILTSAYNIPLMIKVIKTKDVSSLSLLTIFFGIMISVVWMLYALLYIADNAILISNTACLIEVIVIMYYFVKYRNRTK